MILWDSCTLLIASDFLKFSDVYLKKSISHPICTPSLFSYLAEVIADVAISKRPLLFTVWTQLRLRSHQNLEKVYLRSQILERPSIGEYWNISGVPVLPENVIFTFFRTCWCYSDVYNTGTQNGLVLSNTRVPVSGTWSILFPKIFTKFLPANNFCQLLRVTRKRSCTFGMINRGRLELATFPIK